MKKTFSYYSALFFIFAVWFVFLIPYLFQGKVPYASNYQVNFFKPWSHYQKLWGPVKNNAMPDVHTQIYPWKKFTIDTLKTGQIPLWNPYSFSGTPHLANYQSAVFSPLNLLFFIFPFIDAFAILVLLQPILAAIFMYFFLRSLKITKEGSMLGSITFMFCGFIVVWMAYGTLGYAIAFLPLSLFAINKYHETNKIRYLILLSTTIPLSFFSGHFQISFYFLLALGIYILFKYFLIKNKPNTFYLILYTFFGLLLSLPQILPSIELYGQSVRSELFLLSEAIPFQYLITVFAPDFFGNPVTRNDWFGHYAEWIGFIGIIPLILAVYAIFKKDKTVLFFFLLGIISLLLAVKSPISSLIIAFKIPVLSTSALSRIVVLFSFSFAVLSGFGADYLVNDLRNKRRKNIAILFASFALLFVLIWLVVLVGKVYPNEWLIVAKRNLILPTLLLGLGAVIILISTRVNKFIPFVVYCLLLATSFDSFRFAQKWMPADPKNLVYPEVPITKAISQNIDSGRLFGNLGGEFTTYYGFKNLGGYDPLYIDRYGQFIRSSTDGKYLEAERSVVSVPKRGVYTDRVLDFLSVNLVFHTIADTNQGWAYPVWDKKEKYDLVYKDDIFQLFKNKTAQPRAVLYSDYKVLPDKKELIETFYGKEFDFRKTLLLEEDPKVNIKKDGKGTAKIISYQPNKVIIGTASDFPSLLLLSDPYYPGWKAFVDEQEVKILRADYSFRTIPLDKGEHKVTFVYDPLSLKIGFYGFIFGGLGIFAVGLIKKRS